jgi:aspartyl protease family protein
MKTKVMLILTLLTLCTGTAYAEGKVYKCKNAQGGMSYQGSPCAQNTQSLSSWNAKKNADRTLVLTPRENGHYYLNSQVNDKSLTFLIDTGATTVALPQSFANAVHLSCQEKITVSTANGVVPACTTTLATLTVGSLTLRNLPATINPSLDEPLLGMSVLKQFQITQENNEMRITPK